MVSRAKKGKVEKILKSEAEAHRLEEVWSGEFGDDYVDRNANAFEKRGPFWRELLTEFPAQRVLEVGCNLGGNLHWIAQTVAPKDVFGVDVNGRALEELRVNAPGVNGVWSVARELPFRDRWFDLVFTTGVLIHQPESTLPLVMSEIVRCSKRFILCGEYHSEEVIEVPYRGLQGALYKRDYGRTYSELFPELLLRKKGFLGPEEGFDRVTYYVFERT